ncbi:hypothetical protein, partial [Cellulomonas bogoriensis]|uniref:hypothetical protein n=1 Tax=Cellulomonas bogoriensis TaxID=301388 RepID=UPI000553D7B1
MLRQATSSYLKARAGTLTLLALVLTVTAGGLQAPGASPPPTGQRTVAAPPAPSASRAGTAPRGNDTRAHAEQRV